MAPFLLLIMAKILMQIHPCVEIIQEVNLVLCVYPNYLKFKIKVDLSGLGHVDFVEH